MERKNTQMCPIVKLYMYCFMNKQYMKEVQNGKELLNKCDNTAV